MLLVIAAILVVLWLFGFIGHIGGGFIHILLIIAIVIVIYHFIKKS
jgi:hypothetical protein